LSRGLLSVWAPPRLRSLVRRPAASLPFPLEEPGCRLYEWGRDGLWHGLAAVGLEAGDEVLVPAYHHGSEVAALDDRGLVCRFYEATASLEPDPDELEAKLGPRTRALYLIHYLGFGLDAQRWRRWCDERGLLLIEDVAMAWLAERDGMPLGAWGDVSFYSLWKLHGLPDGGAVVCRGEAPPAVPARRQVPRRTLREFGRGFAQRSRLLSRARRRRSPAPWDPAAEFSVPAPWNGPAAISVRMLKRSETVVVAAARRRNHERLVERLRPLISDPFTATPEGSCPFGVPVTTSDPEGLLRHLGERDISATNFWSVPHPRLPVDEFPAAARRRATTVLLPVHQELDDSDLDRVADAMLEFVARGERQVNPSEKAPDFALQDKDGKTVSLDSLAGKRVVLYFYPEADTPGCTAQACGIRDHQAEIASRGAVTIGISPDSPEKLSAFAGRYGLPFTLLSDPDGRVARRYGAWTRRRRPPFRGETRRSTFLIGGDGAIERVFEDVDPDTHDRLVLDALGPAAS
jgi:peroxiredoxin/dTDP-4-amino-4,6-dideoxygalactose transaminase